MRPKQYGLASNTIHHLKEAKNWLFILLFCWKLEVLKFSWVPKPGEDITGIGLGWLIGDVGLLANWFMLGEGPILGLLVNKLSRSMLMFPEFFHVDPTAIDLVVVGVLSALLFIVEDNGWSGRDDGAKTEPTKKQLIIKI